MRCFIVDARNLSSLMFKISDIIHQLKRSDHLMILGISELRKSLGEVCMKDLKSNKDICLANSFASKSMILKILDFVF